jgi:hypothetical protein
MALPILTKSNESTGLFSVLSAHSRLSLLIVEVPEGGLFFSTNYKSPYPAFFHPPFFLARHSLYLDELRLQKCIWIFIGRFCVPAKMSNFPFRNRFLSKVLQSLQLVKLRLEMMVKSFQINSHRRRTLKTAKIPNFGL